MLNFQSLTPTSIFIRRSWSSPDSFMLRIFSAPWKTDLVQYVRLERCGLMNYWPQTQFQSGSSPRGSVRRWTPPVNREVLPHVGTAPPAPSRTHSPGRCSSPRTSPCGSGRSSGPVRSAQRSSSPPGNWWCRWLSGRIREITQSRRKHKSVFDIFTFV